MKFESLKLESSGWNLKVRGEVGKLKVKFESSSWSWKARAEVGSTSEIEKWLIKLE